MTIKDFAPWLQIKDIHTFNWYKKLDIYHQIIIAILIYSWVVIQFIYPLLFAHTYKYKNLTIYSHNKFVDTSKLYDSVDNALKKLHKSNLTFNDNTNIYLGNKALFYLSMYPGVQFFFGDSLARTINYEIFMQKLNIDTMQMKDSESIVPFYEVLAHELVHIWQEEQYNFINIILFAQTWALEGYAVYASDQSMPKVSTDEKTKKFLQKYKGNSKFIRKKGSYTLWYLMVKHAIEKMHKSVDDLHQGKVDYDEVLDSLLAEYNISK